MCCDWRAASTSFRSWTGTRRRSHWWFCHWPSVSSYHGSMVRVVHQARVFYCLFIKLCSVCTFSVGYKLSCLQSSMSDVMCSLFEEKHCLSFLFTAGSSVAWIAGTERFYYDMSMMLGYKPCAWWGYCWRFITPCLIGVSKLLFLLHSSWQPLHFFRFFVIKQQEP